LNWLQFYIVNNDKQLIKRNNMTTFTVPTRNDVSPANQGLFDLLQKNLGKVPNLFATMALSQNALGNYLALTNAKTSFRAKEKEAINLAVSQANDCDYCLAAHTQLGKLNGFTDAQILELRAGVVSFDSKLNALTALAKSFVENGGKPDQQLVENFFAAGYTKESLVDLILVIADKVFTNYLFAVTQIPVDWPAAPALEDATA
jgi:AhpD family alkylhydroperoxidase